VRLYYGGCGLVAFRELAGMAIPIRVRGVRLSGLPGIGIRTVGFDNLPQINQRCLMTK